MTNEKIPIEQIPILITGCINPPRQDWLYLTNVNDRLQQYIESIKYYIRYTGVKYIIFCDNSDYLYPNIKELENLAIAHNKQLEWLHFQGNSEEVSKYGKGLGEDEIVAHAVSNSLILKESNCFCKITGRLFVKNLDIILRNVYADNNYFVRDLYRGNNRGVDTRFYICSLNFYKDVLMHCYSKDATYKKKPLEEIYFLLLSSNYKEPTRYPQIYGISAGNGRNYSKESRLLMRINNLLCRLEVFNLLFPIYQVVFRGYNKLFHNHPIADINGRIR